MTCPSRSYLLFGAPGFAGRHRPDDLVDVFTTEATARAAFLRLRLEVGSDPGWAQLIAVDGDVARPLCWFGMRPAGEFRIAPADERRSSRRLTSRRWAYGAIALATAVAMWLLVANPVRAGAAVAPHVSKTGLVTVSPGQRAEATAVNDSDTCHRTEVQLIDGDGHTVASEAATVCPSQHLTLVHSPSRRVRLRSVVRMYSVPGSIAEPCSHTLEVLDAATGIASIIVSKP